MAGKRGAVAAAIDEGRGLRLVRGAKAIDELRRARPRLSAREHTPRYRLRLAAPPIGLHHDLIRILREAADLNLTPIAEDNRLRAIPGHVIARHLHLREQVTRQAQSPSIPQEGRDASQRLGSARQACPQASARRAFRPERVDAGARQHRLSRGVRRNFFSVPYSLVQEQVEIRSTPTTIEILHKGVRIASHQRCRERGKAITDNEHRPKSHRAHME